MPRPPEKHLVADLQVNRSFLGPRSIPSFASLAWRGAAWLRRLNGNVAVHRPTRFILSAKMMQYAVAMSREVSRSIATAAG
jgi:hypothetical protein